MEGRPYSERTQIFLENTWHGFYDPMRGLRTRKFKYIRNFDSKRVYWAVESKAAREVLGTLCFGLKPTEELYDLEQDPWEQRNLASGRSMVDLLTPARGRAAGKAADPACAAALRQCRGMLRERMVRTGDRLLKGPIPHPCYQRIWDLDGE